MLDIMLFNRTFQLGIETDGGTFGMKDLVKKIDQFVEDYNTNTKPFVWTATADSIFDKIKRLCQTISETQH